ncbi:MAG TPA: hypothetical protein VMV18_10175, partial [bacterium]|nr:hypothetical protein [bacterium]
PADARDIYALVYEAHVTADLDRQAWARKTAAAIAMGENTALAAALHEWLIPSAGSSHEAHVVALTDAARGARGTRDAFLADYLLGRYLLNANVPDASIPWLERARAATEGGAAADAPAIRAEIHAMLGDAYLRTGRLAESATSWEAMLEVPGVSGDIRDRAHDGAARTAWTAGHDAYGHPR